MSEDSRSRRRWIGKAIVSAICLAAVLHWLDWQGLVSAARTVTAGTFALASAVSFATFVIMAIRWWVLVRGLAAISFAQHLYHYFAGTFLNSFTPANLGGDAYRFWALRTSARSRWELFGLLIQERLLGLVGFLSVFAASAAMLLHVGGIARFEAALPLLRSTIAMVLVAIPLLLVAGPAMRWATARFPAIRRLPVVGRPELLSVLAALAPPTRLIGPLLLSLLGVVTWVLAVAIVARGLGLDVPFAVLGIVATLVEFARWLPISIQGIGVREGLYASLFALFGYSPESGFALGTVAYLSLTVALLASGACAALLRILPGAAAPAAGAGGFPSAEAPGDGS